MQPEMRVVTRRFLGVDGSGALVAFAAGVVLSVIGAPDPNGFVWTVRSDNGEQAQVQALDLFARTDTLGQVAAEQ